LKFWGLKKEKDQNADLEKHGKASDVRKMWEYIMNPAQFAAARTVRSVERFCPTNG